MPKARNIRIEPNTWYWELNTDNIWGTRGSAGGKQGRWEILGSSTRLFSPTRRLSQRRCSSERSLQSCSDYTVKLPYQLWSELVDGISTRWPDIVCKKEWCLWRIASLVLQYGTYPLHRQPSVAQDNSLIGECAVSRSVSSSGFAGRLSDKASILKRRSCLRSFTLVRVKPRSIVAVQRGFAPRVLGIVMLALALKHPHVA